MDKNKSLLLASAVFGTVAFLHLIRSVMNWPVSIATWNVPVWLSYIVVIVAGYLSWHMHNAGKN
jgi:hypothetical protein